MNTNRVNNLDFEKKLRGKPNAELKLLLRISKGDERALEQLYYSYYNRLLRFISRITGRADHIDEVINEVMYVVWQKAETYNQNCQPSTWIFGIAYNKARKSMQKSKLELAESLDSMESDNSLFAQDATEIQQLEMHDWLEMAFDVLSSEQRTVVELTYFHGLHYKEISELMKCPENTVKTRMYHARKKLASILPKLENIDFITGDKQ